MCEADAMSTRWRRSMWLSSVQLFPLIVAGIAGALLMTAGALWVSNRGLNVDAPVPEPDEWFVPIQASSAAVWLAASLFMMPRRDLRVVSPDCRRWAQPCPGSSRVCVGRPRLGGRSWRPGGGRRSRIDRHAASDGDAGEHLHGGVIATGHIGRGWIGRLGWLAVSMATAGICVEAISYPDVVGTDFAAARNPLSLGLGPSPLAAALIAPAALLEGRCATSAPRNSGRPGSSQRR